MQTELFPSKWTFGIGLLLAFPASYFVVANVLDSELGLDWLYKPIAPIFNKPQNKLFGWNINLLIVFGPLLAIALNAWSLLKIKSETSEDYFRLQLSVKRKWWNISVLLLAGIVLFWLGAYLVLENIATASLVE